MSLCSQERENVRSAVGKLGWTTRWMKPGLAFDVCQLSSSLNNRKEDDILQTDRIPNNVFSNWFPWIGKHFRKVCFDYSALRNCKNGKSQGGFIVFFFGGCK